MVKPNHFQLPRFLAVLLITSLSVFSCQLFAADNNKELGTSNQGKAPSSQINDEQDSGSKTWSFIHPYSARYIVSSDGEQIGHSDRKLSNSANIWQLTTEASVSKYFLNMKSRELSRFAFIDNKLTTLEFDSETKISFKKARRMNQVFNWKTGLEEGSKGKKKWQLNHVKPAFDRVSHLIQMRADLLYQQKELTYNVSYKGKLYNYRYDRQSEEVISTKMGKLKTIKYSREKENGDTFIVWLSPELNYFPVKIAQIEQDKPEITMTLELLEYESISQKISNSGAK